MNHLNIRKPQHYEYNDEPSEYESIESNRMSNREILFASIPFIFLTLAVVLKLSDKRRKEREGHEVKED